MTYKATDTHDSYNRKRYSWRQVRDCVEGSNAIKEANEAYLPMPAAMDLVTSSPSLSNPRSSSFTNNSKDFEKTYMPWWHPNPAYSAYLQRARFPDITANSMRGIMGMATKYGPEVDLPTQMAYLEEDADGNGNDLEKLFIDTISEILQTGKEVLVADINSDGVFYIAKYTAESNTNWRYITKEGKCILTNISLRDPENADKVLEYCLDDDGYVIVNVYQDARLIETKELMYKGKRFKRIPVVCLGSIFNQPDPGVIPLLGISDIAISIYQEGADLRQGHYLTCNPTLFCFGVSAKETPKVIGSSVIIGITNPSAHAEYPNTDTSAFEHVRECIKDLYQEAASYGAAFVSNPVNRESGEALSIRNASKGTNLVHMINMISSGYTELFRIIAEIMGVAGEPEFEGNTEFAELVLNAQDITALVSAWMQGAIDHDTLLDNMRDAGYVDADKTNEEIKNNIETEMPIAEPPVSGQGQQGQPGDMMDEIDPETGKPTGKKVPRKMETA